MNSYNKNKRGEKPLVLEGDELIEKLRRSDGINRGRVIKKKENPKLS